MNPAPPVRPLLTTPRDSSACRALFPRSPPLPTSSAVRSFSTRRLRLLLSLLLTPNHRFLRTPPLRATRRVCLRVCRHQSRRLRIITSTTTTTGFSSPQLPQCPPYDYTCATLSPPLILF
ncbi:hypothetical protein DFH09DRAFT_1319678 [Mycena vulgaris]|nr:hypothetical protein DFH09DRAFT_1319678 [Mycena vulgaris]